MAKINILKLKKWPIFKQLQLEEALLRTSNKNFCIINQGSTPACVLGISAKIDEVLNGNEKVPIIRRFSGGGNVVIDEDTIFVTFIIQKKDLSIHPYPKQILSWTENIYNPLFQNLDFKVLDNDYVFGERKFGGNAQSITKNRWLHHTSFLWDFNQELMNILKMPKKAPQYRQERSHIDFLCHLKDHFDSQKSFFDKFLLSLSKQFNIEHIDEEMAKASLKLPHRKATKYELLHR